MSANSTGQLDQYQSVLERVLFTLVVSVPCVVFLAVNMVMLWTLRSKPIFCETCRYVFLYNLLLADTVQMSVTQLMYLLAVLRARLSFPLCGTLVLLANFTYEISPIILVLMSLEQYIAVCFPLHHANIVTSKNTSVAILGGWAFCLANILIRLGLFLEFPFHKMESLQMTDNCNTMVLFLGPKSKRYDEVYTYVLFLTAFLTIAGSYVAVTVAARSASSDKSLARNARNTLLLHLVQLGLSVAATFQNLLQGVVYGLIPRLFFVRIQITLYVMLTILPKCLSALIYGLRDPSIRAVLLYHLCCRLTHRKVRDTR